MLQKRPVASNDIGTPNNSSNSPQEPTDPDATVQTEPTTDQSESLIVEFKDTVRLVSEEFADPRSFISLRKSIDTAAAYLTKHGVVADL